MTRDVRILMEGACYHVNTRGNQKQRSFLVEADYRKYQRLLRKLKRKHGVRIFAYCLMPNHVHMIVFPAESAGLSKFMRDLNRIYTSYFNRSYDKVGHLWQGRFKSKVINRDKYLLDCCNYIEFNPVRSGIVSSPADYKWSSYHSRVLGKPDDLLDNLSLG